MLAQENNVAQRLCRGVCRALTDLGYAPLPEFRLACGRRADIFALSDRGEAVIVEIKSSVEDFRADQKWPEYQPWCDRFYFAVSESFPRELVPEECGLIVADSWTAVILRDSPVRTLAPARRKALTLRAALAASERLLRLTDPGY
ncbi:MAG TPA: MmcB family DNA repair protein [Alphaproteobacteria bacterium]